MRYSILGLLTLFLILFPGCGRRPDPPSNFEQTEVSETAPEVVPPAAKGGDAIGVEDLLDALQMEIWKADINNREQTRMKRVALCVKAAGKDHATAMEIEIADPDVAAELIVYLQHVPGGRYRAGLVCRSTDGRERSTTGLLDDPFKDVMGVTTESGARIARTGIIILMSSNLPAEREELETDESAVAIYLRVE